VYTLRQYQEEAVESIVDYCSNFRDGGGGIVVLPTGSGKTLVIAEATRRLNLNTLILCNNMELVKQDVDKLSHFVDKDEIGIYSASLKSKQIKKFTVGTIQSIYKKVNLFSNFGLVIVDECDLFVEDQKMFGKLVALIQFYKMYLVGLTATPYRMEVDTSFDYSKRKLYSESTLQMLTNFYPWKACLYVANQEDLLKQNYLTPVEIVLQQEFVNLGYVKSKGNDYDMDDYTWRFKAKEDIALKIITRMAKERTGVIVFCTNIDQAQRMSETFNKQNYSTNLFDKVLSSRAIFSGMKEEDRKLAVEDFKSGKINVLFNIDILTRGFDYEKLDCAVLIRPTKSISLYVQMLGRVSRKYLGKEKSILIDLAGSSKKFGSVDEIWVDEDLYTLNVSTPTGVENLAGQTLSTFEKDY